MSASMLRLRHCSLWLAAILLAGLAGPVSAQSDADFLAAKAAFDRGDRAKLAALAPKLNSHVLAPYVEYWRLKLAIDDAPSQAVRGYLDRYPDTPLAEKLRVDWLKALARKSDWSRFALDYPPPSGEDLELTCYGTGYHSR
jgi:soluble lytic murein transglycosylase